MNAFENKIIQIPNLTHVERNMYSIVHLSLNEYGSEQIVQFGSIISNINIAINTFPAIRVSVRVLCTEEVEEETQSEQ